MTTLVNKESAYYTLESGREMLMEEVALSNLLLDCVVFLHDARDSEKKRVIGISINANDLFRSGSDAVGLPLSKLEEFYGYYRKHDIGPAIWMSIEEKRIPRGKIWDNMKANRDLWELFPKEMQKIQEMDDGARSPY